MSNTKPNKPNNINKPNVDQLLKELEKAEKNPPMCNTCREKHLPMCCFSCGESVCPCNRISHRCSREKMLNIIRR